MKYYLIAGEASGDLHASNLIKALKKEQPAAEFRCWGGDLMAAQGAEVVKHYRDLAFMGFAEVLMNLRTILGNLKKAKQDILAYQPEVLILIDYPGFNMRIAEFAKKKGIRVVYYISPQVWAWKENRVKKLRRDVDQMITILPFEQEFYRQHNMQVHYAGHPLLDAIAHRPDFDRQKRLEAWGLDASKPLVALLPGSRSQEIDRMLPLMLQVTEKMGLQAVVAGAPSKDESFYRRKMPNSKVKLIFGQTYDILEVADAALVASGTATLETALFKVPEVVCYQGNTLSYLIARLLVKIKYISLVNLILDRPLVKELIQAEFNEKSLQRELERCLAKDQAEYFAAGYADLTKRLGGGGASERAAKIIVDGL